jgi:hypothetical protein
MTIFANLSNAEKLTIATSMKDSVTRELYRLCSILAIDPETFDPNTYPDPSLTFDPTVIAIHSNYGDKQNLYDMCQRHKALTEQIQTLNS